MDIVGKSYHLKDSFFLLVNDDNLMKNKENGHYRPHYFCIADPKIKGIYWAIPQSSRVEKYKGIMLNKIAKSKSQEVRARKPQSRAVVGGIARSFAW